MYSPFIPYAKKILSDSGIDIEFVDVGSRNGIIELASVAGFVNAYGFEPNPEEFSKLVSGTTDASKIGIKSPKYKKISYSPYALSDTRGKQPFYITKGPGACGMKEPNMERLKEIRFHGGIAYKNSMGEDIFAVDRIVDVDVSTVGEFAKEKKLSYIDYLKIDVEGSEYEVLSGTDGLLQNTGVIKVEVCFIPMRKNQKLFSDVDLLLRKYDFDLLRYEISPVQVGLKERTTSWSFGPTVGFPERFGQPIQADAIYVNRSISDKKRCIAQAVVLMEKNYIDEAAFILEKRAKIEDTVLLGLLRSYKGQWRVRLLNSIFEFARKILKPSASLWK